MKIPFDIKYRDKIESGEYKVKTADERNVRIICWDKKTDGTKSGAEQIVALISRSNGLEKTLHYDKHGKCMASGMSECPKDLFLVTPEEELTPFEEGLVAFYNKRGSLIPDKDGVYNKHDLDEVLHQSAKELIELARKELMGEMLTSDPKETALYKAGLADGKAEALKNLPRWKKETDLGRHFVAFGKVCHNGYTLDIEELWDKLPKED